MKSYKVIEFGQPLQRVEEPDPVPNGTEVLVRVTAAGVCHSDVHLWEGFFDMGGGNKISTAKTVNPPLALSRRITAACRARDRCRDGNTLLLHYFLGSGGDRRPRLS